jgi:hypothetical protein
MQTHSKLFNSLNRIEQRAHHELYLSRSGFSISDQTAEFLVKNPSFIREEFGTLFETEQFKLGDNDPFYCPITRTSGVVRDDTICFITLWKRVVSEKNNRSYTLSFKNKYPSDTSSVPIFWSVQHFSPMSSKL